MKTLLSVTVVALLLGGLAGYQLARDKTGGTISHQHNQVSESREPASVDERESVDELEHLIRELKAENQELKMVIADQSFSATATQNERERMKKDFIREIMEGNSEDLSRSEIHRLESLRDRLNLTPDQMVQLEMISQQRSLQHKLRMLKLLGVIDEDDPDYAGYRDYNFNQALRNILSEDQKALFKKQNQEKREQGAEVMSVVMSQRYQFTDSKRFSEQEQSEINTILRKSMSKRDLVIPDAISALSLNDTEKRILAAGYDRLDTELFEKMYNSILENRQSNSSGMIYGNNRNGKKRAKPGQ